MSNGNGGTFDFLATFLEDLTRGTRTRSEIATETLILAGYAEDPSALRNAESRHEEALEDYLRHVDMSRVLSDLRREATDSATGQAAVVGTGALLGAGLWYFVSD